MPAEGEDIRVEKDDVLLDLVPVEQPRQLGNLPGSLRDLQEAIHNLLNRTLIITRDLSPQSQQTAPSRQVHIQTINRIFNAPASGLTYAD